MERFRNHVILNYALFDLVKFIICSLQADSGTFLPTSSQVKNKLEDLECGTDINNQPYVRDLSTQHTKLEPDAIRGVLSYHKGSSRSLTYLENKALHTGLFY